MYVIVWHFQIASGRERAFEDAYGPGGDWARLFERSNAGGNNLQGNRGPPCDCFWRHVDDAMLVSQD